MTKVMKAIKILEMTNNGLQEVYEMETERVEKKEDQMKAIETMTEMAFSQDSMFIENEYGSFVIRGMSKKTLVFRIVFEREGQF